MRFQNESKISRAVKIDTMFFDIPQKRVNKRGVKLKDR